MAMDDSMGGEEVDDEETEPSNPRPGGDDCAGRLTLVFARPSVPPTSPCWRRASIAVAAEDDDEDDATAAVQSDVARLDGVC